MPDTAPAGADLMPSLGRLVRGLLILFWALPINLVVCVQTTRTNLLAGSGMLPPIIAQAVILHALFLIGSFQPHERVWVRALDRVRVLALVNLGLAPFLHWWKLMPWVPHYQIAVSVMAACGLGFLAALNQTLRRLAAMLPDETLRLEVRLFTNLNLGLLGLLVGLAGLFTLGLRAGWLNAWPELAARLVLHLGSAALLAVGLLPVALTMTLIWKIKEAILKSVFHPRHPAGS